MLITMESGTLLNIIIQHKNIHVTRYADFTIVDSYKIQISQHNV